MLQKTGHLALEREGRKDSEGKSRKKRRKALQDSGEKGMGSRRNGSNVILLLSSSQLSGTAEQKGWGCGGN